MVALCVVASTPGSSSAANLGPNGFYSGVAGEANKLTISYSPGTDQYTYTDAGVASINANGPCTALGNVGTCPASVVLELGVLLGDANDSAVVLSTKPGLGWFSLIGDAGDDVLDASGLSTVTGVTGQRIAGGPGADSLTASASSGSATNPRAPGSAYITGGLGNDTIHGGPNADLINGNGEGIGINDPGDGDDVIHAGAGNDWVDSDTGADVIYGEAGDDAIYEGLWLGDATADLLDGGDGDDQLHSGHGPDTLIGGDGNDHVNATGFAQSEQDEVLDTLSCGAGFDNAVLGRGDSITPDCDQVTQTVACPSSADEPCDDTIVISAAAPAAGASASRRRASKRRIALAKAKTITLKPGAKLPVRVRLQHKSMRRALTGRAQAAARIDVRKRSGKRSLKADRMRFKLKR